MKISKVVVGDKLELVLEGRLDTVTSPELEEAMNNEAGDWKGVIVDASKVEYISSSGLRVLLSIYRKYASLEVKGASNTVKEVFKITGLDDVFTIL